MDTGKTLALLELILQIGTSTMARGTGKTASAAELTKANNATMVCFNRNESRRVHEEYGVNTISIQDIDSLMSLRGVEKVVFDTDSLLALLVGIRDTVKDQNKIIGTTTEELCSLKAFLLSEYFDNPNKIALGLTHPDKHIRNLISYYSYDNFKN